MNREVHVRIWERPEVRVLRATRHPSRTRIRVLLFLVALCSSGVTVAAASEPEPARVGLTGDASAGPLYVAIAAGYFKSEGLDPQVAFLKSDAAVSAAVASRKIDIGMASLSAPFYNCAAAHSFKMIASRSSDQTGFPMYALVISRKARAAGLSGVRGLIHARIGVAD